MLLAGQGEDAARTHLTDLVLHRSRIKMRSTLAIERPKLFTSSGKL